MKMYILEKNAEMSWNAPLEAMITQNRMDTNTIQKKSYVLAFEFLSIPYIYSGERPAFSVHPTVMVSGVWREMVWNIHSHPILRC